MKNQYLVGILQIILGFYILYSALGLQGFIAFLHMEGTILGLIFMIIIKFFKTDLIKIGLRLLYSIIKRQIIESEY